MPVNKNIPFKSGGMLVVTIESVALFDATEAERKLLADIADAIKLYERATAAAATTTAADK